MKATLPPGLVLLASIFFFQLAALPLQPAAAGPPPKAVVTVVFADGSSTKIISVEERFRPVALSPGETVTIQAQAPPQFVDTPVFAEALDGGEVSEQVAFTEDGIAYVAFRAGTAPGLYRVLFSARGRTALLQFTVGEGGPNEATPSHAPGIFSPAPAGAAARSGRQR